MQKLCALVLTLCLAEAVPDEASPRHIHHRHKKLHQAGWAGAGFAAGAAVGPAGSAAVGATKYRHDLKAGGHKRKRAIVKIGGPIAAGAVAGPPGSAAYAVVEHRHWIKRHILHQKSHRSTGRHS